MTLPLPPESVASVFARSFTIQGSWNYRTMLGSGFAFALLPGLRRVHDGDGEALDGSTRLHLERFNAHPYLSTVALGATLRLEADREEPGTVRRFKAAVQGPLGGLGDALVWASWLPAVSLAALALVALGAPGWVALAAFLTVYNLGHVALRAWGFAAGLRYGRDVGALLRRASLSRWIERVRAAAALLLGVGVGAVLGADRGGVEAGAGWVAAGAAAFLAGLLAGPRLWRPAAVAVAFVVAALTLWGVVR